MGVMQTKGTRSQECMHTRPKVRTGEVAELGEDGEEDVDVRALNLCFWWLLGWV